MRDHGVVIGRSVVRAYASWARITVGRPAENRIYNEPRTEVIAIGGIPPQLAIF